MTSSRPLVLASMICLATSSLSYGQALRIQGQGAAAQGQASAFTAQADDPSALHYNPAGMTQLRGVQNVVGTLLTGGTVSFQSPNGATATGDRNGSIAYPPPGHVYLTANLGDIGLKTFEKVTAGVGLLTPFGSLIRYPTDGPFRTAVTFATLPLLDIKPTVAYQVNEQLSLGVGADIYTFSGLFGAGHLEQKFIWPGGGGVPAGSSVELNGKDTAVGFNVSFLYTPFRNSEGKPLANIGLVYRSQATLHLAGQFRANGALVADTNATLVLPQVITGAIALWPVRDELREWKLELDVDYVGWKSVRNLDVHLSNGGILPQPLNWRTSPVVMIGTEYKWLRPPVLSDWEIALRGGYAYATNPIPDQTFNPSTPASDYHVLSVGLGMLCHDNGLFLGLLKCGSAKPGQFGLKAVGVDLAYQALIYESRTIVGNRNPTVNGNYDTLFHAGTISLRVNM